MGPHETLALVREKYIEEQEGITTGDKAEEYRQACEDYPAMMAVAHHLWAREVAKNMP